MNQRRIWWAPARIGLTATIVAGRGVLSTPAHAASDDGSPGLPISDVSVVEANSGTTAARFTVTLTGAGPLDYVTVDYATVGATASQEDDYDATAGSLTFALGDTTQTVEVTVRGDTHGEPAEAFTVRLSRPSGASITDDQAVGTIQNDDGAAPAVSIADASMAEGDSGTHDAPIALTLDRTPTQPVTVRLATSDAAAKQPGDYRETVGTVLFSAGQRTRTIGVPVPGNTIDDVDRAFVIDVTLPINATIADGHAVATIADDEPGPKITVGDGRKYEGSSGGRTGTITVSFDKPSAHTVTVRYATVDGTAKARRSASTSRSSAPPTL